MEFLPIIKTTVRRVFHQLAPPELRKRLSWLGFVAVHSEGPTKVWVFGLSRPRRG